MAFEAVLPEDFGRGEKNTPFTAANPRGEVPVLLIDAQTAIFESTVIMEFIEERWPEPPVLPAAWRSGLVRRRTVWLGGRGCRADGQPLCTLWAKTFPRLATRQMACAADPAAVCSSDLREV